MAKMNLLQSSDQQKKDYIKTFWDELESNLLKKRFNKKHFTTKWTSKRGYSTESSYGIKKHYTFTNGNKVLVFSVEVRPFTWGDGTIWVEINLEETKNIVIPRSRIHPKAQGAIWRYDYDPIFFLTNTDAVVKYIKILELTALDVSVFDSIPAALENLGLL